MTASSRPGGSAEHVSTSSASQFRLPSLRVSSESFFQQNKDAGLGLPGTATHRLSSIRVATPLSDDGNDRSAVTGGWTDHREVGGESGSAGEAGGWKDHPKVGGTAISTGMEDGSAFDGPEQAV